MECVTVVTRLKPSSDHSEAAPWVLEADSLLSLSDREENVDFEVGGKRDFFSPEH